MSDSVPVPARVASSSRVSATVSDVPASLRKCRTYFNSPPATRFPERIIGQSEKLAFLIGNSIGHQPDKGLCYIGVPEQQFQKIRFRNINEVSLFQRHGRILIRCIFQQGRKPEKIPGREKPCHPLLSVFVFANRPHLAALHQKRFSTADHLPDK